MVKVVFPLLGRGCRTFSSLEVSVSGRGLPGIYFTGISYSKAQQFIRHIKASFSATNTPFPYTKKVLVSLPEDVMPSFRDLSLLDMPIVAGILSASLGLEVPATVGFLGSLSLDGTFSRLGVFTVSSLILDGFASNSSISLVLPEMVSCLTGVGVLGISCTSISQLIGLLPRLPGTHIVPTILSNFLLSLKNVSLGDYHCFSSILGQYTAKRALSVSAAGGHHLLLIGPPGVGKTLLVSSLSSILAPLSLKESLQLAYSCAYTNVLESHTCPPAARPIVKVSPSVTKAALFGGGVPFRSGAVSQAHAGILWFDEFGSFPIRTLNLLKPIWDSGISYLYGNSNRGHLYSSFSLIATATPCACGYYNVPGRSCSCTPGALRKYRSRFSTSLLERFDMCILMDSLDSHDYETLRAKPVETSQTIRARVVAARTLQVRRYVSESFYCNARIPQSLLSQYCILSSDAQALLVRISSKVSLRKRAQLLRVSRTLADLDASKEIQDFHVSEAFQLCFGLLGSSTLSS